MIVQQNSELQQYSHRYYIKSQAHCSAWLRWWRRREMFMNELRGRENAQNVAAGDRMMMRS